MYSAIRSSRAEVKMLQSETNENFTRQGSLRRVVPSDPKDNLFGRQNEDLNKMYKNFHQEYIILAEYRMIQTENIPGIYVIPSRESPLVWFGIIYVRSGPYEDGIFRFTIELDEKFPDCEHPKVIFESETFHPVIYPETNELHLLDGFPTWNKSEQHIWQVLKYIQWIFYNLEGSSAHAVNKDALDLYKNNQDAFKEKIRNLVKVSKEKIYDEPTNEDKHYFVFERYNPEIHDAAKLEMLSKVEEEPKSGHSWVLPGSFKPLGRSPSPDTENES